MKTALDLLHRSQGRPHTYHRFNEPVKDRGLRVARQGRSKSEPVKYATSESSFDPLSGSETVLAGGDARKKLRGMGPVVALRRGSGN